MPPPRPHARMSHLASAVRGNFVADFLRQATRGTDFGRATYLAKHLNIILAIPQPGRLLSKACIWSEVTGRLRPQREDITWISIQKFQSLPAHASARSADDFLCTLMSWPDTVGLANPLRQDFHHACYGDRERCLRHCGSQHADVRKDTKKSPLHRSSLPPQP